MGRFDRLVGKEGENGAARDNETVEGPNACDIEESPKSRDYQGNALEREGAEERHCQIAVGLGLLLVKNGPRLGAAAEGMEQLTHGKAQECHGARLRPLPVPEDAVPICPEGTR